MNESSRIFKTINDLWDNFVDKKILMMIDGTTQKKGSFVCFCQLLKDALEIELTRSEEASKVNKEFSHFRWEVFVAIPKSLFSFERKFPINYKNKHFFVRLKDERVRERERSSQVWILALQSQEHSSLIPKKSLLRCNRISRRQKTMKIEFLRQRRFNVFLVMIFVSQVSLFCLNL